MSDNSSDTFLAIDNVQDLLSLLSEQQLIRLVEQTPVVGTTDGSIENHPLATILEKASVVVESDEGYYLHFQGKRLEFSAIICPRSNWAWKNGPEGNLVLPEWQDALLCPIGIAIEKAVIDGKEHLKKKIEHDGKEWVYPVWNDNFEKGKLRTFEYSGSGRPVNDIARQTMVTVFEAVEKKLQLYAKQSLSKPFKNNKNGPNNKMFLFAKRPMVVHNAVPLDEGRALEYFDIFGSGTYITEHDFHYNRIPEVLVVDHRNRSTEPMSFHDIHLLGSHAVFQMIITPRAYLHDNHLSWEYRLVALKVLGKKQLEIAVSPTKQVQKRKAVFIDIGDNNDEPEDVLGGQEKRLKYT